jgi:uncharacterized protein (DUF4213/DUF364 family)
MQEPLTHFYSTCGFDPASIKQLVCGEIYVGLMLDNGNIGVCSTLQQRVDLEIQDLDPVDLTNTAHRIVLTAYYNSLLNYSNQYNGTSDIFDEIDFRKYSRIVMVGCFQSLLNKFQRENIDVAVFDNLVSGPMIVDPRKQQQYIRKANAIILTGTSIYNETFSTLLDWTKTGCDIFVLGPSTILHPDMFLYKNINVLFGALFEKKDLQPLQIIEKGKGTRDFLPFMKKVYLKRDE